MADLLRWLARQRTARREQHAAAETARMAEQLAALHAILDDLEYGIAVLDQDQRALFLNRAFRRIWRIPEELTPRRPTFLNLMYHGPGVSAYAVSPDRLGDYVDRQLKLIQAGEERPLSIRLANGEVRQFRCKALPGGGRLLTYDDVSELTQHAERLERLASIDGMTGLNNRRHFLALAEAEWARFRRYTRPLALLMMDIDLFKSVNDRYGHDVGDEVIKVVAGVLSDNKRTSDIVGRLGGEEFALLLPEATLDNACNVAERLRRLVADYPVVVEGHRLAISISIGASHAHADMRGIDELIKQADVALYDAKRSGRDRVCRYEEPARAGTPVPDAG